jgi:hypothetical protein
MLRRDMRRAILTGLVIAATLTGCGGSESIAVGWKTHHVDDGGFSIEVPAGWRTVAKIDPKALDAFVADNPEFGSFKEVLAGGLIKLLAFDPDASNGFATNVNVVVHALGETMPLSEYARQTAAVLRRLDPVRVSLVRLPAGRCARFSYEHQTQVNGALRWLTFLQYGFVRGGSEYVVTFTTLSSQRARYRTTFARSARSFSFD